MWRQKAERIRADRLADSCTELFGQLYRQVYGRAARAGGGVVCKPEDMDTLESRRIYVPPGGFTCLNDPNFLFEDPTQDAGPPPPTELPPYVYPSLQRAPPAPCPPLSPASPPSSPPPLLAPSVPPSAPTLPTQQQPAYPNLSPPGQRPPSPDQNPIQNRQNWSPRR